MRCICPLINTRKVWYLRRDSDGHLPVMGQVKRLNIGECRAICCRLEPQIPDHDSYKRLFSPCAGLFQRFATPESSAIRCWKNFKVCS